MTIKDIARLSGYGLGTVSRVLNNHPDVSKKARERILAVVHEQGFEPNANAKYLKTQAQSSVAVLVKGSQNFLFAGILERVQDLFRNNGEEIYVAYLDEEADEVQYAVQLVKLRRPKGIIFLGGDLDCFRREFHPITVPCVLLTNDAHALGFENLSSFSTDDTASAEAVIEYLYRHGHQKIGVLGGNLAVEQISVKRLRGVEACMRRLGLPFAPKANHVPCRFSMADGYAAAKELLGREPDITALFALGDVIALGAMRAICDLGLRIPDDISIVGYDGIDIANFCIPRLTTVRQDAAELAAWGVQTLLQAIHYKTTPVYETIDFELVERESVSFVETR